MKFLLNGLQGNLGSWLYHHIQQEGNNAKELQLDQNEADTDILFHLAAQLKESTVADQISANIDYLYKVISYAKENRVKRIVMISTVSVYGNEEINEEGPVACSDTYAATKFLGEQLLLESGLEGAIFRVPALLEIKKTTNFISRMFSKIQLGETVRLLNAHRPFYHFVSPIDIYNCSLKSLEVNGMNLTNLSSGGEWTLLQIAEYLIKKLNSPSQLEQIEDISPAKIINVNKAIELYDFCPVPMETSLNTWIDLRGQNV